MNTYTFHVSLPGTGRAWRKIEIRADQTLEQLHVAIQRAYGWDGDHLYSFFMSNQAWDTTSEYRLPEGHTPWGESDEEEEKEPPELEPKEQEAALRELYGDADMTLEEMKQDLQAFFEELDKEPRPGDVRKTTIESLELKGDQTFMYLFDYGAEWRFRVRVHAIDTEAPENVEYRRIAQSVGKAPEPYKRWD